ncbi:hypothetical protein [Stenotrophomonas sp. PD6]|uniref:hypothetical protein n=1 Tax=Stenotrophomonas sp. PD6 TaxID=3368612 RepID=UPI003BA194F1
MARNKPIDFPVLLVECDTTGVTRDDPIIHIMCVLVDKGQDGNAHPAAIYTGYQEVAGPSSEEAFKAHGIPDERLKGESLDLELDSELALGAFPGRGSHGDHVW